MGIDIRPDQGVDAHSLTGHLADQVGKDGKARDDFQARLGPDRTHGDRERGSEQRAEPAPAWGQRHGSLLLTRHPWKWRRGTTRATRPPTGPNRTDSA